MLHMYFSYFPGWLYFAVTEDHMGCLSFVCSIFFVSSNGIEQPFFTSRYTCKGESELFSYLVMAHSSVGGNW